MKKFWQEHKRICLEGMRDGIPIGMGYFAVSFSLGIVAKQAGLTAGQGFLASALVNASAGEYAGFVLIAANAPYVEMIIMTLVANARYLLMSFALSQRFSPETPLYHRFLIGYGLTDELFGITIARQGSLNPYYTYGAFLVASPCWAVGTMFGVIAGNLLPGRIVSALGVALYGMFLAIIIPPARKNKIIAGCVALSFAASFLAARLPFMAEITDGTKTILMTIVISVIAALLFPVEERKTENDT